LCGVFPDGMIQAASDAGNAAGLVSSCSTFCVSTATMSARCADRAQVAAGRVALDVPPPLHYSDYHRGQGSAFHEQVLQVGARARRHKS
jgi:hypothetical protein